MNSVKLFRLKNNEMQGSEGHRVLPGCSEWIHW